MAQVISTAKWLLVIRAPSNPAPASKHKQSPHHTTTKATSLSNFLQQFLTKYFPMDFVKNLTGGSSEEKKKETSEQSSSGGGFMDKMNSMAGGGRESEKNEDLLDKGQPAHPRSQ